MTDRRAHWAEVRELLLKALAEVGPGLDAAASEAVADFIEYNEFEVALRWMQSVAEEQGVSLSANALQYLKRAAFLMAVDL